MKALVLTVAAQRNDTLAMVLLTHQTSINKTSIKYFLLFALPLLPHSIAGWGKGAIQKGFVTSMFVLLGTNMALHAFTTMPVIGVNAISIAMIGVIAVMYKKLTTNPLANRLDEMTHVIQTIAEGEGNLAQRLDNTTFVNDETGDMGRWINSFIDNLDGIVGQVIITSTNVSHTNEAMLETNREAFHVSNEVATAIERMLQLLEEQMRDIGNASTTAESMKKAMDEVVHEARVPQIGLLVT